MRLTTRHRPAYIFLITVLVVGAIASASATSLVILGIARQQTSLTAIQSAQALEFARTCGERAVLSLRANLAYDGGGTVTFPEGSCTIQHLGGFGNDERGICTIGRAGNAVRRLEMNVLRVLPTTAVTSWDEVTAFTRLCP